jgi:hypothetical protein
MLTTNNSMFFCNPADSNLPGFCFYGNTILGREKAQDIFGLRQCVSYYISVDDQIKL